MYRLTKKEIWVCFEIKYNVKKNSASWIFNLISKVILIFISLGDSSLHRLQNCSSVHWKWWWMGKRISCLRQQRTFQVRTKNFFATSDGLQRAPKRCTCLMSALWVSLLHKNVPRLYILNERSQALYLVLLKMSCFLNCSTWRHLPSAVWQLCVSWIQRAVWPSQGRFVVQTDPNLP